MKKECYYRMYLEEDSFSLKRGTYTAEGMEDPETEETILRQDLESVPGWEAPDGSAESQDAAWSAIDEYIQAHVGQVDWD